MDLSDRVSPEALPLAVLDIIMIGSVVSIGIAQHASFSLIVGEPQYWLGVLGPFMIGWALMSIPLGAYAPGAAESAKAAIPLGIRAWVPAVAVALAIRSTGFAPGGVQLSFAIVITALGALAIGVGRWLRFRLA
jgi:Protein of unknown function (DUF3054).